MSNVNTVHLEGERNYSPRNRYHFTVSVANTPNNQGTLWSVELRDWRGNLVNRKVTQPNSIGNAMNALLEGVHQQYIGALI